MEIDSMIKARKPKVPGGKRRRKRKGKPLSKRLLSPRQNVVILKSKNNPPSIENFESISPKQLRNKKHAIKLNTANIQQTSDNTMPEAIVMTKNKSQKNTKRKSAQASVNVKQIEDSYKKLQMKQWLDNEQSLARKDPHRLRIPVSPRVLTFNKPLSISQARKLHQNADKHPLELKSTTNYRNIVKKSKRDMRKRVKNVYSTVTSKQIDALGNKTNASEILQQYINKKKQSEQHKKRSGIREKDFVFFT